ncbi:hypothetical protein PRIPAC_94061, partial [Pristionchus pacificus]
HVSGDMRKKEKVRNRARKKNKLSNECIEKNIEEVISVAQKEGVIVNPLSISSRKTVYECPYNGCSKEFNAKGLLHHIKVHSSQEDLTMSCPFCDRRMNSLFLIGHLENGHPELNAKAELKGISSTIDPKQKAIHDTLSKTSSKRRDVAEKLSAVLKSSIFMPSPSSMSYAEFRISLRSKLIENTKENGHLIFKFLVRTNALEWGCLICADHSGLTFKNPISLRLNALFHLEKHANEEHFEYLSELLKKEWSELKKEIPSLPVHKMRTCGDLPVGRSFLSYSLLRDDDCVGETMDVIDRCYLDGPSKKMRNALCLVCYSPFTVSLFQPLETPKHFLVDSHQQLNAKGWSEFSEVHEIAEVPRREGDVQSALLCSSFLHVSDEQGSTPKKLFKWRCTLCSLDVAVFPSSISFRFFALRHLETEHPKAFNDHFYDHEWSLLQMETSLVNMRRYSQIIHIQQQGRPIDITDPSDFLFPWTRPLRVNSPEFLMCGHCFHVSTEIEIRDHLATHGLIQGESATRIVVEVGGQEALINEKTIRSIRKSLSVPASILYDESLNGMAKGEEGERIMDTMTMEVEGITRPLTPTTPLNGARCAEITETPKSKYSLRARSATARYVPIEEEETNNDTMSSEESDSGLEKNYHTMSGDDDTMEETADEDGGGVERPQSILRQGSNSAEKKKKATNANTCTESSVAFEDLFDTGVVVPLEKTRRRERERAHEKAFRWEGAEPPQLTAEQMELIREFKEGGRCTLCPRTKGYRGVGRMTNVEQSMMAHIIVNHADNDDARAIITRKRYLMATSIESGGVEMVPPFLLQSVHPRHLTCSRCMDFKCAKQSNLVVHWESCTGVRGNRWKTVNRREKKEEEKEKGNEEEEERKTTPKRVMNSVRCPLCREGWRKSIHYSDDVSVAIHLMMKHTSDKEAYAMAMLLEEETNLQSSFPFINLTDSFALRAERPDSGIQCAICDVNSPTLASAIRHSTRSHATGAQKIEANFAAGGLSCPLLSSTCGRLRSILTGRPRSTIAIHFLHLILTHSIKDEGAKEFMEGISEEDASALREETNLRLDVRKSVEWWQISNPRLVCALCSRESINLSLHTRHFDLHGCGTEEDRLGRGRSVLRGRGKTPVQVTPRPLVEMPASIEKRGRGKAPEAGMACSHCERVIYASGKYAPSVSMDIHLMKMHPKETTTTSSSTFPFIDFSLSTGDDLQCSLCEYSAKESRYSVPHAWTKHPEESKRAQGMAAWAEYELSAQRKREKQRISCSRGMKRMRVSIKKEKEGENEEEMEDEEGMKRRKMDEKGTAMATATAFIRTPRQRSAVSRWLDTSLAETSTYSPTTTFVDADLKERLDRLFKGVDSPSTSQPTHASSSIFKELPEVYQRRSIGTPGQPSRAEDISHIKGVEGVRCSVCPFKGRDTETLRIHFNEAHQEVSSLTAQDVFPCAACSRIFHSKKKWRCHCEEDHSPRDNPFQCFKCQYRYETHQKLRSHQIRVHESEILVHPDDRTCHQCNKLFGSLRAYQNHKRRHEERERMEEEEEEDE